MREWSFLLVLLYSVGCGRHGGLAPPPGRVHALDGGGGGRSCRIRGPVGVSLRTTSSGGSGSGGPRREEVSALLFGKEGHPRPHDVLRQVRVRAGAARGAGASQCCGGGKRRRRRSASKGGTSRRGRRAGHQRRRGGAPKPQRVPRGRRHVEPDRHDPVRGPHRGGHPQGQAALRRAQDLQRQREHVAGAGGVAPPGGEPGQGHGRQVRGRRGERGGARERAREGRVRGAADGAARQRQHHGAAPDGVDPASEQRPPDHGGHPVLRVRAAGSEDAGALPEQGCCWCIVSSMGYHVTMYGILQGAHHSFTSRFRTIDDQARVPISAADVARLMEAMGIDRVIAVDLHCGQIQGFFGPRVPVDNLDGGIVGLDYFGCKDLHNPVVVSPDAGGVYRAKKFKEGLEQKYDMQDLGLAMIVKQRARAGSVDQMDLVGSVKDCDCIIVDDMIDTAGTLCKASDVLLANGARRVFAFATHGLLSGPGNERIANSGTVGGCHSQYHPQHSAEGSQ